MQEGAVPEKVPSDPQRKAEEAGSKPGRQETMQISPAAASAQAEVS